MQNNFVDGALGSKEEAAIVPAAAVCPVNGRTLSSAVSSQKQKTAWAHQMFTSQ